MEPCFVVTGHLRCRRHGDGRSAEAGVGGRHARGRTGLDGAVGRRTDGLLQLAHLGGQRRLVAHRAGHAAQKRRHFRTRLREAEDVVDEHQHVLALDVAEVFCDGQRRQPHPQPRARRLVHLAEHHRDVGQNARFLHFKVEVVAFTGTLAHAREHREAAVLVGDVADQFLNKNGLAHARAAEEADLAAPGVGRQQVNHLDARLQNFVGGLDLGHRRRRPVDGVVALRLDGALAVDGLAQDVHHAAQRAPAHGHRNGRAQSHRFHAPDQAVGGRHGHAAHRVVAQVLGHLQRQVDLLAFLVRLNPDGAVQFRQLAGRELHVHDRTHDLQHAPDHFPVFAHRSCPLREPAPAAASRSRRGADATSMRRGGNRLPPRRPLVTCQRRPATPRRRPRFPQFLS